MKKGVILTLAASLIAAPLSAQTVTSTLGTTRVYNQIESEVTGNMMSGMRVSAVYASGATFSGFWGNLDGTYWGVQNSAFRLRVGANENTYDGDWRMDLFGSTDIVSLTFEGGPQYGNVIFDRPSNQQFCSLAINTCRGNTTQTSLGAQFDIFNASNDGYSSTYENAVATYTDIVQFGNESLKYDAFTKVSVAFNWGNTDGPDSDNSPFYFRMDTDLGTSTVPEPSTYLLMTAGLAGLGVVARRRKA